MIILPDIHGRKFWKQTVEGNENEKIIFLGDYFDPYGYEGIFDEDAIANFEEIIDFRNNHKDNVIMLLGNHDCGYLWDGEVCSSRRSRRYYGDIRHLLQENYNYFDLAHYEKIGDKEYLFSHSGIHKKWLFLLFEDFYKNNNYTVSQVPLLLNNWLHLPNTDKEVYLGMYSYYRGYVSSTYGSCVWADVREWSDEEPQLKENKMLNAYQIFGHTQLELEPIVKSDFACLDVRRGFILTEDNKLIDKFHPTCEITYDLMKEQ